MAGKRQEYIQQSSASLENIEEVLRPGQQLQVACACGRPK